MSGCCWAVGLVVVMLGHQAADVAFRHSYWAKRKRFNFLHSNQKENEQRETQVVYMVYVLICIISSFDSARRVTAAASGLRGWVPFFG